MNLAEITKRQTQIAERLAANAAKVADLDRRREETAPAALTDTDAALELEAIERQTIELSAERQTLEALGRAVDAEAATEEARLAAERERERRAEARVVAGELLQVSAAADDAAKTLAGALAHRWELARRLYELGGLGGNGVFHKAAVDRMLGFHGVSEFAHLAFARQGEPLAAIDRRFVGPLVSHESPPAERNPRRGKFGARAIAALAQSWKGADHAD